VKSIGKDEAQPGPSRGGNPCNTFVGAPNAEAGSAYWIESNAERVHAEPNSLVARTGRDRLRVNQQQVNISGARVGINRPDLQYTLNGKRFYEELDRLSSWRGLEHQARTLANDPKGALNIFWVE
jgi:hypothetical protein